MPASQPMPGTGEPGHVRESGWAPLRAPAFRRLWSAQFVSNTGSWMQTVAAQWVMTSLTSSAVLVAAMSAVGSLPVLLLAIPAGALGDLADRRRLILAAQAVMLVGAGGLAVLSALSALTPAVILLLLFLIGCGSAASAPSWQTLQPELVPPERRPEAIALGSVNQNLARAVGPALGGALLAATSAAVVFGVNAVSFVAVLVAVAITAIPRRLSALPREHAVDAVRAGGRYVAHSPTLLALIARAAAFILPAGAIWALLPLVARHTLGLSSTGYGLLLGCVGAGALAAATFGPAIRKRLSPRALYAVAAVIVAASAAVLAYSTDVYVDSVVLVAGGSAWIIALGLLGSAYQSAMPPWVKTRGIAYYLIAFQGSSAIGALGFGAIAQAAGLRAGLVAIAVCLAVALVATWRLALPAAPHTDMQPDEPWPLPELDAADGEESGPVMVTVRWPVRPDQLEAFLAEARELSRARRRTGATRWRLYHDAADRSEIVESFVLGSWAEHERQHARMYPPELAVLDRLDTMLAPGRQRSIEHYVAEHG